MQIRILLITLIRIRILFFSVMTFLVKLSNSVPVVSTYSMSYFFVYIPYSTTFSKFISCFTPFQNKLLDRINIFYSEVVDPDPGKEKIPDLAMWRSHWIQFVEIKTAVPPSNSCGSVPYHVMQIRIQIQIEMLYAACSYSFKTKEI